MLPPNEHMRKLAEDGYNTHAYRERPKPYRRKKWVDRLWLLAGIVVGYIWKHYGGS